MIKRIALLAAAACSISAPRKMLPRRVKTVRDETLPLHRAVALRGGGDARDVAARALGYCIGAGSTILFAPIVYTLATHGTKVTQTSLPADLAARGVFLAALRLPAAASPKSGDGNACCRLQRGCKAAKWTSTRAYKARRRQV